MPSEILTTRREQMTAGAIDGYSNFIGDDSDYRDWYGFIGEHRDSEPRARSNFRTAVAGLEELDPDGDDYREETFSHWGVGWITEVYVRPDTPCQSYAEEVTAALADYPVLDDEDCSELEHEEVLKTWQNCYNDLERLGYIRDNRSQFEFHDFADLRQCVKGETFCGYASEMCAG